MSEALIRPMARVTDPVGCHGGHKGWSFMAIGAAIGTGLAIGVCVLFPPAGLIGLAAAALGVVSTGTAAAAIGGQIGKTKKTEDGSPCSEITRGSAKTKCEGLFVARITDPNSHGDAQLQTGAEKVLEGGLPVSRVGEASTCGGQKVIRGAGKTIVGGPSVSSGVQSAAEADDAKLDAWIGTLDTISKWTGIASLPMLGASAFRAGASVALRQAIKQGAPKAVFQASYREAIRRTPGHLMTPAARIAARQQATQAAIGSLGRDAGRRIALRGGSVAVAKTGAVVGGVMAAETATTPLMSAGIQSGFGVSKEEADLWAQGIWTVGPDAIPNARYAMWLKLWPKVGAKYAPDTWPQLRRTLKTARANRDLDLALFGPNMYLPARGAPSPAASACSTCGTAERAAAAAADAPVHEATAHRPDVQDVRRGHPVDPAARSFEPFPEGFLPPPPAPVRARPSVGESLDIDAANGAARKIDPFDAQELARLDPDTQVQVYLRESGYSRDFDPYRRMRVADAVDLVHDRGIERIDVTSIPATERDVDWPHAVESGASRAADSDPSAVRDYVVRYQSGVEARFRGNRDAFADMLAQSDNITSVRGDNDYRGWDLPRTTEVSPAYRAPADRLIPREDGSTPMPAPDRPSVGRFTRIVDIKGEAYRFGGDVDPKAPVGELHLRNVEFVPVSGGADVHAHRDVGVGAQLRVLRPIMKEAAGAGFSRAVLSYGRATHRDGALTSAHGSQAHTQTFELKRPASGCETCDASGGADKTPNDAVWTPSAIAAQEGRIRSLAATAAADLYARAAAAEPKVTGALHDAVMRNAGFLQGYENVLKTEASLTRKIADQAMANIDPTKSPEARIADEVKNVKDALRYTVQADTAHYTQTVTDAQNGLLAQGNTLVKSKNTWAPGQPYRGLNTFWRTPDGQLFEVQFHTPESYMTKSANHVMYEEGRLPTTTPERQAELNREMQRNADAIPMPPGALDIGRLSPAASASDPGAARDSTAVGGAMGGGRLVLPGGGP